MINRLVVFVIFITISLQAQNLATQEGQMSQLGPTILKGKNDSERVAANNQFITLFEKALGDKKSLDYPFDSLVTISKLSPPDKSFRLFTWNMPKDDGTYAYFGYVQFELPKTKEYKFVKLNDLSDQIQQPDSKFLNAKNWYGTHYYSIIQTSYKKQKYYTLLGVDFNNRSTRKKIIDCIIIDKYGGVAFGDNIFEYNKKSPKRVVFEYAAQSTMSVRYNEDKGMIIYDHLSPMREGLEGQFQFYGPDFTYDALKFKKGKWYEVINIDARNEKNPNESNGNPRPNMGLNPGGTRDTQ